MTAHSSRLRTVLAGAFALLLLLTAPLSASAQTAKPNILVIWGDDIGIWNISHNSHGMMGYQTPNIDRIANEGLSFTDYYGQQSCTAGRAAFIGGNVPVRTGMTKVGVPGAKEGWQKTDVTMATVLKSLGYATGQFGKNHRAIATSTCRRCTASMSFSAISITSMLRKSPRTRTIRRIRSSGSSSGRAG